MESAQARILIVEDDLATLYALQTLFVYRGWDVSLSRTVAGALDQLARPFDWIVLDLELADGDGEEILRHMRETGVRSRVVVLSAVQDPERHDALKALGPDLVLSKPVRFGQLIEACGGGTLPPAPLTSLDRSVAGLFDRGRGPEAPRFPGFSA